MIPVTLLLLAAGVAPPVPAILAQVPPAASGAQKENLPSWKTRFELSKTAAKAEALVGVTLPPAVFSKSVQGLPDLRLIDAGGTSIPYALRIRTPREVPEALPGTPFNPGVLADGTLVCSLDLDARPGEHNLVSIPLEGTSYRRHVRVEGSDDGATWNQLLKEVFLVRLTEGGQSIDQRRFSYPPSRYRYLRVQVSPDLKTDPVVQRLDTFQVLRTVRLPGITDDYPGQLVRTDAGRYLGAYARATLIDLDADLVPVSGLLIDVAELGFSRPFTLEAEVNGFWQPVFNGTLEPNPKGGSISIPFPETLARRLRLQIIDASNTPLTISNPRFAVVRREILFRMPAKAEMPLYLYTGNAQAQSPSYDIKTQLSPEAIATTTAVVNSAEPNPAYVPPPVAWSEQHPRLIDGVLAFAGLVLAAILATLARAAIRRQEPPKVEVA